jgi:hypothetical protein
MLTLALLLSLGAEPPINDVVELERQTACAPDAGAAKRCALLTAFRDAKPPASTSPLFTIGTYEDAKGSGLQFLDLTAEGAAAAVIKPDDDAEKQKFLAIIAGLAKGQRKDPLLDAVARDAKKQPHLATKVSDGALVFKVNAPLGGNWLRASAGKLYLLSFAGGTERPSLRITEFPDDRK